MDAQDYWGYLNKNGKVVIQPRHEGARSFHEGIALVWESGYPGSIDRNETLTWSPPDALDMSEEELTDLEVDLGDFHEGLARVKAGGNPVSSTGPENTRLNRSSSRSAIFREA